MSWLVLGFHADPPDRDFGDLVLGDTLLRRVEPGSDSLAPHVDPRWAITEAFVVQPGAASEPWEVRLVKELAAALADDVSGQASELDLAALPPALSVAPRETTIGETAPEVGDFADWLARITDHRGLITDSSVQAALQEHYDQHSPLLRVARARARPEDLEALSALVRERCDAELPRDYLELLSVVGAVRVEAQDDEAKSPFPDVLLPAKAVTHYLTRGTWLSQRDDGIFVPFYRFGDDEFFAFDFSKAEPHVVGAYFTGDIEPVAASFSTWLRLWQSANLTPELPIDDEPTDAATFGDAVSFERWWKRNMKWVREMYDGWQPS